MELKAKFVKVLSRDQLKKKDGSLVVNSMGMPIEKMEFIVQVPNNKPTFLKLETFNQSVMNFVQDTSKDTELSIDIFAESREWNEKWFTSVIANNVEANRTASVKNEPVYSNEEENDLPF